MGREGPGASCPWCRRPECGPVDAASDGWRRAGSGAAWRDWRRVGRRARRRRTPRSGSLEGWRRARRRASGQARAWRRS
ncbi:MAG: hypothetical protein B7Z42_14100, partial [Brevundimonas sp. 12-68-7]